jgi:hypothetical protein
MNFMRYILLLIAPSLAMAFLLAIWYIFLKFVHQMPREEFINTLIGDATPFITVETNVILKNISK